MNFLKRLTAIRKDNEDRLAVNETAKIDADREHQIALARLASATEQADRLADMNTRNHFGESLTHAFRGKTA